MDMEFDPGLTALEVLGIAIKSELDAARLYDRLAKEVEDHTAREKLRSLKDEKRRHQKTLEGLYAKRFPGVELLLPSRSIIRGDLTIIKGDTSVPELLELAMEVERSQEEFYLNLARRSQDQAGRIILRRLIDMKRVHYNFLKAEYNLLPQVPECYEVGDFHLDRGMMHFGP